MPRGATRRAWASPAATSTATAGSTWPSPTSTASRPRFYQNLGARLLRRPDRRRSGWRAASRYLLGFGIAFLDADNDGRLDLLTANGHVNDLRPDVPYAMPTQFLRGEPAGALPGPDAPRPGPRFDAAHGRPRAWPLGDLDNDGRLDAVVVAHNEPWSTSTT